METARRLITDWLPRTADSAMLSPNEVQSLLFDLYGELHEGPALDVVKQWLSLSIERELFSADEVAEMLTGLLLEISDPVAQG